MSGKRLLEFDALRGVACMLVLLFHYAKHQYLDYDLGLKFKYGVTGVDLFFMISGFVIYMTLEKTNSLREFINSRGTRLYPTFWVAVTITFCFCLTMSRFQDKATIGNYLLNLTMIPLWFHTPYLDNSYWTLLVELLFYGIIAFFFFSFRRIKVMEKSIALLIILLLFNVASIYLDHGKKIINYLPILMYWNLFLSGICFYKLKYEENPPFFYHLIILFNLFFLYLTHDQGGMAMHHVSRMEHLICNILYVLIFYLLIYGKSILVTNKITVFIGTISYSIYLLHQTIGYILIDKFYDLSGNSYLSVGITIAIVFTISYLITYYLEKPFMKWSRRKTDELLKTKYIAKLRT